ncbi:hypothetical protein AgCh_013171 [Apium graveolens]
MKLCAASTIRFALAPEIKYDVLEEDNPKNLWEKLTKTYHSNSLANKLFLKKDLFGLKMEEDGDLRDHLNRFNGLINQLNNLDEKLKDEDKVVLLLVSLPKKYNTVMTSLLVGKTKLDLDETIVILLEAERLMKQESSDTSDGSAFVVCARDTEKKYAKKHNSNISVSLVEADEDVLLVQEEKGSKEEWVLDSGCSHHICGRREWFSSYKRCEGKIVTLPNGKTVKVADIGETHELLVDGTMELKNAEIFPSHVYISEIFVDAAKSFRDEVSVGVVHKKSAGQNSSNEALFNYAQSNIPIMNDEIYDFWSIQMKTLFISHDLWDLVEDGYEAGVTQEEIASWSAARQDEFKKKKKKDERALHFIQQGVSKEIFPRIMGEKTSKEAWDLL